MHRLIFFLPLVLLTAALAPRGLPPTDHLLADGVLHRHIITDRGEVVNILLLYGGAHLLGIQADERYDGLEDLRSIYDRLYRERLDARILAAVNAGSWRFDRMTPAAPRIVGGEPVDIDRSQNMPSLVISPTGRAAIGQVTIAAQITWKYRTVPVENINRRASTDKVVLYNRFSGRSIPSAEKPSEAELHDAVYAQVSLAGGAQAADDLDTAAMLRDLRISARDRDMERGMMKIVCVPAATAQPKSAHAMRSPADTIPMLIQKMTTDTVAIPANGYVISLGSARDNFSYATVGDTIRLIFSASGTGESPVRIPPGGISEVVTGYPQLVRDGQIGSFEIGDGARPESFYTGEMARTAAGISAGGDTLMLVTIDPPDPSVRRPGATLARLAELMLSFGATDALNLENGNATGMLVEGIPVGIIDPRAKISSALVVMKTK